MSEYIEREFVLDVIKRTSGDYVAAFAEIAHAPAADVKPVIHGRWIGFLDGEHIMPERYYRCSNCGKVVKHIEPYCRCGARMDLEDKS